MMSLISSQDWRALVAGDEYVEKAFTHLSHLIDPIFGRPKGSDTMTAAEQSLVLAVATYLRMRDAASIK